MKKLANVLEWIAVIVLIGAGVGAYLSSLMFYYGLVVACLFLAVAGAIKKQKAYCIFFASLVTAFLCFVIYNQ